MVRFLTDFADEAVLLPLAAGVGLVFAVLRWRRGAAAWFAAVAGVMAATLLLKLLGTACAPCWPSVLLRSSSGHTAAGTAVYGGLLFLLLRPGFPRLALVSPVLVAAVIGGTRLVLGVHTVGEVLCGAALGVAGASFFALRAGPMPPRRRLWPVLAVGLLIVAPLHGLRLPAEVAINRAGLAWWPFCQQCR